MACTSYSLSISQFDLDNAVGNTPPNYDDVMYVNYYDCNGDFTTTFLSAGYYDSIICNNDDVGFVSLYYYNNNNASLPSYSSVNAGTGICEVLPTPTPTPTFVPPTPTPTPTIQGTCWTIKIANGDAPVYCNETNDGTDQLYIAWTDNSGVYHNEIWFGIPYSIEYPGYNTYYLCLQTGTYPSYIYGGNASALICSTEESFGSCFDDSVCSIPPSPTPTGTPASTPTSTPPLTKYLVELCGGGEGPYVVSLASGDFPAGIGWAYKLFKVGTPFNGIKCWEILENPSTGTIDYDAVAFGVSYNDCATCSPPPTPTPTPVCTVPTLNSVTLVSGSLFTYNYATPTNCNALTLSYSRDQISWSNDTSGCSTGRQRDTGDATGTWYFRLTQICTVGGSADSNIVSYTYPTPTPTTTTTLTATPTQTTTPTPTKPPVWYQILDCNDSSVGYSIAYTAGVFSNNERCLAVNVSTRTVIVIGSTTTLPGGILYTLTSLGATGCPVTPTPTQTPTGTPTQTPTQTPTGTPTQTPTNTPTTTTTLTATPTQTATQTPTQTKTPTPTTTTTLTATSTQTATPTPTRTSLPCDINYSNVANEGGACGLYIQNIPPCQAGTLTAGSLASNSGCTVGTYVIDWYLNTTGGTPSFTSGSAISAATDVTVVQPFTNEPVQGGTWYPVVRFAFLNGVKYTSNINLATSIVVYSPDLGTVVSPLCAESYNCSSGNSGSTYPVSISYTNTTQNATQAQRSISWSLSSINKYFAWRFYGYTVYDTISISYVSPSGNTTTQIENWVVGDDASTTNLNSNPKVYNPQNGSGINIGYLAMVTPLTGFTYTNGDYLLINITPNPTISNTNWAFQAKCLTDSSSLDCGSLFNGNFAQYGYNVSGIGASYNSSSCYLTVSGITRNGPTYTATTSNNNFFKYNGSYVGSSVGTTVISPAIVNASVNAYFQYPYYPYAYCTNQNSSTIITKSGATITLTFNDTTDYNTYKTQYTNAANSPYITNYTGDSTNLNYYKYFNLGILSGTTCGDSLGVSYSYTTHITSPFTFDDVNKKITVVLSPGVNGLTSGVTCDNTYSTVQSTINSINSNIASSNYTITTYVRRGNSAYYTAVGSSWLFQYSSLINYYADYAVITPKPNVCQSSISGFVDGTNYWISYPYYMAYTITNSSDPVNNFKVENYLNSSGVPGTLTLLYQKTNGVVVYP